MLILYGAPAVGKTTLGKHLAKKLSLPFFDIDELIEEQTKTPGHILFKDEKRFRQIEKNIVKNLPFTRAVLACGGGTVLDPENVSELKKRGQLIYCHAPLSVIKKRFAFTKRSLNINVIEKRLKLYERLSSIKINMTLQE